MTQNCSRPKGAILRSLGVVCFASFVVTGCITPTYVDRTKEEEPATALVLDPVVYEVRDAFRQTPPKCIAVLPFKVAADDVADGDAEPTVAPEEAEPTIAPAEAELVRRAFYAHLAPQQKRDLELARIDGVIGSLSDEQREDYRAVGRALRCDALMTGTVTRWGSAYLGLYSRVGVGAEVRIIRARDGEVLWEGRHQAVSHGGAMPISIVGAAFGVVDAALNMQEEQLQRVTDDLARRLVSTIPDETDYRFVTADALNLREGPGTGHRVRERLRRADRLAVLDVDADHEWLSVRTSGGREGYVSVRYVSPQPADYAAVD